MLGLYSSLIPPYISCLAGWPSHFLPGLRARQRERSAVGFFFLFLVFGGRDTNGGMQEYRIEGWSNESWGAKKLSGCWADTSQKDWLLSTLLHEVMFLGSSLCMPAGSEHHNSISHSIFRSHVAFHSLCSVGLQDDLCWSVNQCYDQYNTDRLMGSEAEELVVAFWCRCVVT